MDKMDNSAEERKEDSSQGHRDAALFFTFDQLHLVTPAILFGDLPILGRSTCLSFPCPVVPFSSH
jgi:hypothetical protein